MAHFPLSINIINRWVENNRGAIIRILVAFGVLGVSFILAPRIAQGQRKFLFLFLLIIGIGSAIFLLRFKSLGLLGLIPASLVVPFGIGTGTETKLNAAILLLVFLIGLWLFEMIARERRLLLVSSRTFIPLFLFMIVAILAFMVGQLPWFNFAQPAPIRAQIGGLAIFLLSGGALLLIANQIKSLKVLSLMVWIFLALGSIYVLGRFLPGIGIPIDNIFQEGAVLSSLFWIWLIALAFSQALINRKLTLFWRSGLFILVFMTMYVSMIREKGWTSGWLPPLTAMGVIIWFYLKRLRAPILLCAVLFAGFAITKIVNFMMAGDNPFSLTTRLAAWRILWEIIKVNPILGLGPANYYWYTPLFPIMGFSLQFNSHNNYVDLVAQTGLLGLACFLWIAWELGWLGLTLKESAPEGFAKAYVYGAIGGLAGTLVAGMLGDWVIPFVYNIGFDGFQASMLGWIFLGGLISVEQIVRCHEKLPDNPPI
jgi:O-antigen ligase